MIGVPLSGPALPVGPCGPVYSSSPGSFDATSSKSLSGVLSSSTSYIESMRPENRSLIGPFGPRSLFSQRFSLPALFFFGGPKLRARSPTVPGGPKPPTPRGGPNPPPGGRGENPPGRGPPNPPPGRGG